MQVNPHAVIYIAGQHEHAEYWQSYGLKTELKVRIQDFSFDRFVSRFFDTLPRSLLLIDPAQKGIIRIGVFRVISRLERGELQPYNKKNSCRFNKGLSARKGSRGAAR